MNVISDFTQVAQGVREITAHLGGQVFFGIPSLCVRRRADTAFSHTKSGITVYAPSPWAAFAAIGCALAADETTGGEIPVARRFSSMGLLLDCARNAVAKPETVKKLICCAALMGYNYLQLYVEDCFAVEDEPYFGYMRGRYSKTDLQELDTFGRLFGVELVPCIQTLAHLPRIFMHWQPYAAQIQDKADVLLVGEERTYVLIENMIKTCRECFTSPHINIGMDEAFHLGQGKYFEKNGFVPKSDIMRQHLRRVLEICTRYGYQVSMWADMFLPDIMAGKAEGIPEDVQLIYWNYGNDYDETYDSHAACRQALEALQKAGLRHSFAAGAHKWHGFTPLNRYSRYVLDCQMPAVKQSGVQDCMLTLWADEGAECSAFSVLPTLAYLAQENLEGEFSRFAERLCSRITGYTDAQLLDLGLPNELYDAPVRKACNPAKYLFYVDALYGMEDLAAAPDYALRYARIAQKLERYAQQETPFSYLFETQAQLCRVLELKATLTQDIDSAYRSDDRQALEEICTVRIPELLRRLRDFTQIFKAQWHRENRPIGFEVQEYRIYGLMGRLGSIGERLCAYVEGRGDLPELEEEKLTAQVMPDDPYHGCRMYNSVVQTVTYCYFSQF